MLKLKKKLNQKQNLKRSNYALIKSFYLFVLGFIFCGLGFAQTMELKIKPNTSQFYFSLPSNPTTGYRWTLKSFDKKVIKFRQSEYQVSNPTLIGGGGVQTFYFKVLNLNTSIDTLIELEYSRSWENVPANTQTVHISTKN
jgi:inhibitor of cysteine peptidase